MTCKAPLSTLLTHSFANEDHRFSCDKIQKSSLRKSLLTCVCVPIWSWLMSCCAEGGINLEWNRSLPLLCLESGFPGVTGVVVAVTLMGHSNVGWEGVPNEAHCMVVWLVHRCGLKAVPVRFNVFLLMYSALSALRFFRNILWWYFILYPLWVLYKKVEPSW